MREVVVDSGLIAEVLSRYNARLRIRRPSASSKSQLRCFAEEFGWTAGRRGRYAYVTKGRGESAIKSEYRDCCDLTGTLV